MARAFDRTVVWRTENRTHGNDYMKKKKKTVWSDLYNGFSPYC